VQFLTLGEVTPEPPWGWIFALGNFRYSIFKMPLFLSGPVFLQEYRF
jgi:hypothetical protein